ACTQNAAVAGLHSTILASVGVGSVLCAISPKTSAVPDAASYGKLVNSVRAALPRDGFAVVLRSPAAIKPHIDLWGPSPTDLDSMRAAKRALDEKDILNRGRFLL
ncbi:MAG: hypothetical protein AB7O65_13240, partial [Candidatus Korobacteraceae bacterium]